MKTIYIGWPSLKLAPDLAVEESTDSLHYGWLFAKHPDGQWVSLADLSKVLTQPAQEPTYEQLEAKVAELQEQNGLFNITLDSRNDNLETMQQTIKELQAQIDAAKYAWQPIETAPEDEMILLAWKFGIGFSIAMKSLSGDWISFEGQNYGNHAHKSRFAYWMPLLETPTDAAIERGKEPPMANIYP